MLPQNAYIRYMNSKRYIETKARSFAIYGLVVLFTGLYIWRLASWVIAGTQSKDQWIQMLVLGLIVGLFSWFLLHLKMKLKIGRNSLKVSMNDGIHKKTKIKWSDVKSIEAFKIPEAQLWSGLNISFDPRITQFNLGDNCGIKITTNDDNVYLIYSEKLYNMSDKILAKIKA